MRCSACQGNFVMSEVEGVKILVCDQCNGMLIHYGELKKITHPTIGDVDYSSTENVDQDRLSSLTCPCCKTIRMLDINFISYSDIIMKYCQKCKSIWLERSTLDKINNEIDKINLDKENWEHALSVFLSNLPF